MNPTVPLRSIKALPARNRWILLGIFAVGLLLVGALAIAIRGHNADRSLRPAGAAVLYTLDQSPWYRTGPVRFRALDPITLADRADAPSREFARDTSWAFATDWAVSADGSTDVSSKYGWDDTAAISSNRPAGTTIVVRDLPTGKERSRLHVEGQVWLGRLSDDGSRLLLIRRPDNAPAQWSIYATATGKLLATWSGDDFATLGDLVALDDRMAFFLMGTNGPNSLPSAEVIAYDLQTGAEIGRQRLDNVVAGTWQTRRTGGGIPIRERRVPGLALSADGRRLAVVDPDATRLTLLDADQLRVERVFPLDPPAALLDRLSLFPRPAYAKEDEEEGAWAQAVFSRDGKLLYVSAQSTTIGDQGDLTMHHRGLMAVDLDRGTVRAVALANSHVFTVVPTADGSDVYVITDNQAGRTPYLLRRLDAHDLTEKARQDLVAPSLWLTQTPGVA